MKSFSLKELLGERSGENYTLHRRYINPAFADVLKIIGFDRFYTKGKGAYLYDESGMEYLDFISGYGVFNLGRNHPVVHLALKEYMSLDYPNLIKMGAPLLSGLLAEKIIEKMPEGIENVFFANSGAEGVEASLKFARGATRRPRILYIEGAYHGLTFGALSVNGDEHFREGFGELLPGCQALPRNDLEALEHELAKKDVAGFILEPIQGKGVYLGEPDFLKGAEELCKKYGTCFILDEVQSGMGRTGRFLALEHWDLKPDMVIISKSLSGGEVPVSALAGRKEIFQKVFSRLDRCVVHSSTFSQNAMAMVAGLTALHVLESEKLIENAEIQGEKLIRELRERVPRFDFLKEIRGKGLMIAIEFGSPKSLKLKAAWKILHKADAGLFSQAIIMPLLEDHHILTQVAGHNMDVIKLLPTLCVTEKDVQFFLSAFDSVMERCHRLPGPIWEVATRLTKHALKGSRKNSKTDSDVSAPA